MWREGVPVLVYLVGTTANSIKFCFVCVCVVGIYFCRYLYMLQLGGLLQAPINTAEYSFLLKNTNCESTLGRLITRPVSYHLPHMVWGSRCEFVCPQHTCETWYSLLVLPKMIFCSIWLSSSLLLLLLCLLPLFLLLRLFSFVTFITHYHCYFFIIVPNVSMHDHLFVVWNCYYSCNHISWVCLKNPKSGLEEPNKEYLLSEKCLWSHTHVILRLAFPWIIGLLSVHSNLW